jgi:hypothetical protein
MLTRFSVQLMMLLDILREASQRRQMRHFLATFLPVKIGVAESRELRLQWGIKVATRLADVVRTKLETLLGEDDNFFRFRLT